MSVYLGCDEAFFIAYTCYAPGTLPLDARFTACIGFFGGFKFLIKDFFIDCLFFAYFFFLTM